MRRSLGISPVVLAVEGGNTVVTPPKWSPSASPSRVHVTEAERAFHSCRRLSAMAGKEENTKEAHLGPAHLEKQRKTVGRWEGEAETLGPWDPLPSYSPS